MENDSALSCCKPVMTPIRLLASMHDAQEEAADSLLPGRRVGVSDEIASAMANQLRIILATTAFCWDPSGE